MTINTFIATSGACILKAGANVNSLFTGTSAHDNWEILILQAEAAVNIEGRKDYSATYATLSADVKYLLEEAVTNLSAMYAIQYDMSGYTSRAEAQTMLDVLYARYQDAMKKIEAKEKQSFIDSA